METFKFPAAFDAGAQLWIVKPNDFNRGCGLELAKSREDIKHIVSQYLNGYRIKDFDRHQNDEQTGKVSFPADNVDSEINSHHIAVPNSTSTEIQPRNHGIENGFLQNRTLHYPNDTCTLLTQRDCVHSANLRGTEVS